MIQVSAPGLPIWPRLLADKPSRTAMLATRIANWKSWWWACWTTECLGWSLAAVAIVAIWYRVADEDLRVFICLLAFVVAMTAIQFVLRPMLAPLLARQLFSTRLKIHFTPDAIQVFTSLYEHPLILWRTWNGHHVKIQFHTQWDQEAQQRGSGGMLDKYGKQGLLHDSVELSVILSTNCPTQGVCPGELESILRTLPIVQMDSSDAGKFTMVLSAAFNMTHPDPSVVSESWTEGIDIDET